MGRRERPLDASTSPLCQFARALRDLRRDAGQPSYRQLAAATHYSVATLARAASGQRLPTLKVTLAYVTACGGDLAQWRDRWYSVARLLRAAGPPARRHRPEGTGPELVTPMQLPPAPRGFLGRCAPLGQLDALVTGVDPAGGAPPLVAIVGGPGAGKTALTVHWAHQVRARFRHGVIFADLHGDDPNRRPVEPEVLLDRFLGAFGVPVGAARGDLDGRSALWRSVVNDRQLLLVLDNAASAEQVRPLLATGPGSATVITSRTRLSGIVARDGAARIVLGPMPADEANRVLRHHLAPEQRRTPARLLTRVAELCAGLPLALRIAAERAARHPHQGLGALLRQLTEERHRLDLLCSDDGYASMRTVFSCSYRSLDEPEAALFRLLGLHRGGDISTEAVCALAASPPERTRRLMDRLAAASLVDEVLPGRFRLHDLLRLYARERAGQEDPALVREVATRRLLGWYLHSARAAVRQLFPGCEVDLGRPEPWCAPPSFAGAEAALAWCEAERVNLVAASRQSAEIGEYGITLKLPEVLAGFFALRHYWGDWIETYTIGLTARALGEHARPGPPVIRTEGRTRTGGGRRPGSRSEGRADGVGPVVPTQRGPAGRGGSAAAPLIDSVFGKSGLPTHR